MQACTCGWRLAACTALALVALAPGVRAAGAPAGSDAVYRQAEPGGAEVLTNVPDSDGYELLVAGSRPAAAGASVAPAASTTAVSQPPAMTDPVQAQSQAAAERARELADARGRDVPPAPLAFDEPEVARTKAATASDQAFQDMTAAGGATARLRALYEASQAALAARKADTRGGK